MRLQKAQAEHLLSLIAEGLHTDEINKRAAEFKPPYSVSRSQVEHYRSSRKVEVEKIVHEGQLRGLTEGLATKEVRVAKLTALADKMFNDLMTEPENQDESRWWLRQLKGIGRGDDFQVVETYEFNAPEVQQFRGVLDDIAREVGHRLKPAEYLPEKDANSVPPFVIPADFFAPSFVNSYRAVRSGKFDDFAEEGGRGSTKSTFVPAVLIEIIKANPTMHALCLRQVADTIRDSVYSQFVWCIDALGLTDEFKCGKAPLEITYLPTGQKVYFRGADDPGKIKSIKPAFGYIGAVWFEEYDQFFGPEAIRTIEQSIRGGDKVYRFKTWNTPRSRAHWVNKQMQLPNPKQWHHRSTYLDVPPEWLGQPWLDAAELLKKLNPKAYEHEYLGVANGAGGQVFENVILRDITDAEIAQFDRVLHGVDWGYFPDPFSYGRMHYDAARLTLYIFGEYRATKQSNRKVYDALVKQGLRPSDLVIADSAEPKSIADFREYGADIRGAEKGPDSVDYSMKWLQSLAAIVIDPRRAPAHAEEFVAYELEQDKDGNFISAYPDKNNHAIDDVRYATNLIWRKRGQ